MATSYAITEVRKTTLDDVTPKLQVPDRVVSSYLTGYQPLPRYTKTVYEKPNVKLPFQFKEQAFNIPRGMMKEILLTDLSHGTPPIPIERLADTWLNVWPLPVQC